MVRPVFLLSRLTKAAASDRRVEDGTGAGGGHQLQSLLQFRVRGIRIGFAKAVGGV
jgi:hypothetical protein